LSLTDNVINFLISFVLHATLFSTPIYQKTAHDYIFLQFLPNTPVEHSLEKRWWKCLPWA